MKNMQISGTGNSRFMKSAISETETWEGFLSMLRAGTFPFDFNGINDAGVTEKGTPYNVDNVLKDSTAELLGGGPNMVPDEAFVALKGIIDGLTAADVGASRVEVGSYTGAGKKSASTPNTLTFGFEPKLVVVSAKADQYLRRCVFVRGVTRTVSTIQNNNATYGSVSVTWNGNTLSWYDAKESSAYDQLDASGTTYCYVAIG